MFSELTDNLLALLQAGGPVIVILAVLSFVSIILIVYKLFDLSGISGGSMRRLGAVRKWQGGDRDGALTILERGPTPADRVLRGGMQAYANGADRDAAEGELARLGNGEVTKMSRYLRTLEVIALVSPLLGLLGTVLGMIQSFRELELAEGSANAALLAGGIWQALLTTAAGLIVAIPALVAANLLSARVERATHEIEDAAAQLLGPPKL